MKLKPCRFCGSPDVRTSTWTTSIRNVHTWHFICCMFCGATGPESTQNTGGQAGAMWDWNNMSPENWNNTKDHKKRAKFVERMKGKWKGEAMNRRERLAKKARAKCVTG